MFYVIGNNTINFSVTKTSALSGILFTSRRYTVFTTKTVKEVIGLSSTELSFHFIGKLLSQYRGRFTDA